MLFWGVGDFLIHKSSRKFGVFGTLFLISGFAFVFLLPFVFAELMQLRTESFGILLLVSVIMVFGSIFDFWALKEGKLAVIDSLFAFEVPFTAMLAFFIIGEALSLKQAVLAFFIVAGLLLVAFKPVSKKELFEKGTYIAVAAAIFMGFGNFYVGVSARQTSPLLTIWATHAFALLVSAFFLIKNKEMKSLFVSFKKEKALVISLGIIDNAAWILYSFAVSMAPIAVVVAISESYIAIAVFLGVFINKEKLNWWQYLGIMIAIISAILLSNA